ncbi:hypothetical protein C6500_11410 [Candidatus Poribacteria bacterium]|nr:MAG: hypothetical protein C6500_11410 [Candidatus Poribacteria bacterium]
MKGIYCVLLLVCGILLLYSEVGKSTLADDSNQPVGVTDESEGKEQNTLTPNWVPQPSDIEHVEEQRLLTTVKIAQNALIEAPKDATAWGELGNVYFVHGWEVEAAECYRNAVEIAPNDFHWLYYLGLTTYKVNPQAAAQTLAEAIKLDPRYAPAHIYRAAALRSLGHFAQAKVHLETANELDPQNPYASLWLGELALATQQFETARSHLQRALKLNPEQSEAHAAMAQVARILGETDAATQHAQASRKQTKYTQMHDPLWWNVLKLGVTAQRYAERGNRYLQQGDFKRAVSELEVAISGLNKDAHLWLNYGIALLLNKQYSEAVAVLENTLTVIRDTGITPRNPTEIADLKVQSHYNLGLAYYQGGKIEKAIAAYQTAIQLEPNFADAYGGLGVIYRRTGDLDAAIRHCQKAIKIAPENIEFHQNLTQIYWQKGMYDRAAIGYRIILELNPSDENALHHLGIILLSKQAYDEAVSCFQKVLQTNPDNALTHGALGTAYYKLGEEGPAIHEFQEVLRLDPQNQDARKMLKRLGR